MMLGTAGLTAALCVDALRKHDIRPDRGQIVVTGASGGVGSIAVAILAKLGYDVAAVTGKESARVYLESLGASEVLSRAAVTEESGRPLLSGRWAGGVDTVGGNILSTVLRATRHFGCVAACGNAGGHELPITVFPFILRGVTLTGVDAAMCPLPLRHAIWEHLGGDWRIDRLSEIVNVVELTDLPSRIDDILAGRIRGRLAVAIGGSVKQSDGDVG
jgi:putative YhdH/YhfP family quinone oxidoreductase